MNPGSDIGKKELSQNLRVKFTEIFVHDIQDKIDIEVITPPHKSKAICEKEARLNYKRRQGRLNCESIFQTQGSQQQSSNRRWLPKESPLFPQKPRKSNKLREAKLSIIR